MLTRIYLPVAGMVLVSGGAAVAVGGMVAVGGGGVGEGVIVSVG